MILPPLRCPPCHPRLAGPILATVLLVAAGCGEATSRGSAAPAATPGPSGTPSPTASTPVAAPVPVTTAASAPTGSATTPQATTPDVGMPAADAIDAQVPRAAAGFTIDGNDRDWQGIPAIPAPFSKKAAGMMRLAWRDDGLYGFVRVKDPSIETDERSPWKADTIELWIDPTGVRSDDMDGSTQLLISPKPVDGPGPCAVMVSQGGMDANAVKTAWTRTPDGYAVEFYIPTSELAPAAWKAGAKLGFNYAIDLKGKAIEEFHQDKDTQQAYHTPSEWGLLVLHP